MSNVSNVSMLNTCQMAEVLSRILLMQASHFDLGSIQSRLLIDMGLEFTCEQIAVMAYSVGCRRSNRGRALEYLIRQGFTGQDIDEIQELVEERSPVFAGIWLAWCANQRNIHFQELPPQTFGKLNSSINSGLRLGREVPKGARVDQLLKSNLRLLELLRVAGITLAELIAFVAGRGLTKEEARLVAIRDRNTHMRKSWRMPRVLSSETAKVS